MTRSGFFNIHRITLITGSWRSHLDAFVDALKTTLTLATTSALVGPLLFSILAYIMVHTRWAVGAAALDFIIGLGGNSRHSLRVGAALAIFGGLPTWKRVPPFGLSVRHHLCLDSGRHPPR